MPEKSNTQQSEPPSQADLNAHLAATRNAHAVCMGACSFH